MTAGRILPKPAHGAAWPPARFWFAANRCAQSAVAIGHRLAPVIDLLTRVWLAQAFLHADLDRAMAPAGHVVPGGAALILGGVTGSGPGLVFEAVCPFLLTFGLGTRVAALALLAQLLALDPLQAGGGLAPYWSALLGWLLVMGPGALSIDRLIGAGVRASALPLASALSAWTARATRVLGPGFQLMLRLWIAVLPAALAIEAIGGAGVAHMTPDPNWVPRLQTMFEPLLSPMLLGLAALVAIGLFTRMAALAMLALAALSAPTAPAASVLWWMLLLALPVLHGPGPLALDRWLLDAIMRRSRAVLAAQIATLGRLPHVVIVGGGFGGLAAARSLRSAPCRITLVDANNYHLFQPLLYQVATAGLSPADIATPIREVFRDQPNVQVLLGEVTGIDAKARRVEMGDASIPYDYVVLATGARHSYFGHDEWSRFAPGLKGIDDALDIRGRLLLAFEQAENCVDEAERRAWLTFIIVGGGPTGVELAGAVAELAHQGLSREFRAIDPARARVILVEAGPRLLPPFPPHLSIVAAQSLAAIGVEVRTGHQMVAADAYGVTVGNERIAVRTILWAAGVMASPAGRWLGVATDRSGRLIVERDLSIANQDRIFVIGDLAASTGWNGKPVPGLAPAAKQGGHYVGRVISARLEGRPKPPPFRYRHLGSLATIGRRSAVADFAWLRVQGALAWWLWGAAHVTFLVGTRNRVSVVVEWVWAYLTLRRSACLITGNRRTPDVAAVRSGPAAAD